MTVTSTHSAGSAEEGGPKAGNMRSLSRSMEVFAELQRAERPQRLSDLARTCGMSLPTTLRILRVLQDFGMVSQTDKSYRIGPAVLPAARSYLENDPLVVAARPILQQVASQTDSRPRCTPGWALKGSSSHVSTATRPSAMTCRWVSVSPSPSARPGKSCWPPFPMRNSGKW